MALVFKAELKTQTFLPNKNGLATTDFINTAISYTQDQRTCREVDQEWFNMFHLVKDQFKHQKIEEIEKVLIEDL